MEESKIKELVSEINKKLSKKLNIQLKTIYDEFLNTCQNIINLIKNKIDDIKICKNCTFKDTYSWVR